MRIFLPTFNRRIFTTFRYPDSAVIITRIIRTHIYTTLNYSILLVPLSTPSYFDISGLPLGENVPVDEVQEVREEEAEAGGQVEGLLNLRAEDGGQVLAQARAQLGRRVPHTPQYF
jgi:hypothetical protein